MACLAASDIPPAPPPRLLFPPAPCPPVPELLDFEDPDEAIVANLMDAKHSARLPYSDPSLSEMRLIAEGRRQIRSSELECCRRPRFLIGFLPLLSRGGDLEGNKHCPR
jgi:hypothetical protein